jgi:structural hemagglutinin/hemolysin toxin protein RtxA
MYVLVFHVPLAYAEKVKEAIFSAGAGGGFGYEKCCFEVEGTGQFLPTDNAHPFIGERGKVEKVRELRCETTVADDKIKKVVEALKKAHPYEVPSYHLINIYPIE